MRGRSGGSRGFTLVEVVIALSLISLILLGLLSALRTFGRTSDALADRADRIEEVVAVSGFLRATTARLVPGQLAGAPREGPVVEGRAAELTWLGVLPARFGGGGVHLFHLALESVGSDQALVLRFLPYARGLEGARVSEAEPRLRLDRVSSLSFAFEARDTGWRSDWTGRVDIPEKISIQIVAAGDRWPDIVVHPMLVDARGVGSGEIVIGGSAP